ncbi:MAG: hypothetical protein MZV70_28255 [Desulfobacterales bacterium]|nr:hypothetical protein [Desulfobacterales bacterium]
MGLLLSSIIFPEIHFLGLLAGDGRFIAGYEFDGVRNGFEKGRRRHFAGLQLQSRLGAE